MKRIMLALLLAAFVAPANADIFKPLTSYKISIGSTPAAITTKIGANRRVGRVICTVTCTWGMALTNMSLATAVSTPVFMTPNREEYFKINPGQYIIVMAEPVFLYSGALYFTEME